MSELLNSISEKLQQGKMKDVVALCEQAVAEGNSASDILNALLGGMSVIGVKFKNNEVFVPEVLIAARAMNGGLNVIKSLLVEQGVESKGKVIIGTVKGDLHDIGKNLVSMMMTGAGFEVLDLGVDVPTEKYIAAVEENNPDILCMSALLTTTMPNMKLVIQALEEKGLRDKVKVMVGGAPVTDRFAEEIGADKYSADAASAADEAKKLVEA
ncbi:corrinoid protein [Anaerotalea alkaliphila]|uniref:Cobalamin-binding protein n=1 Tax=Anaerotalea alkaliphila TaxID=2662126 RepID=A0A7X5KL92_9FIRM|nr:corrinoid protein [Anaerotalea alkaliphila]NDL66454.1 cobalamin-binding protein [Anaerotalea alkaliphila]